MSSLTLGLPARGFITGRLVPNHEASYGKAVQAATIFKGLDEPIRFSAAASPGLSSVRRIAVFDGGATLTATPSEKLVDIEARLVGEVSQLLPRSLRFGDFALQDGLFYFRLKRNQLCI